MDALWSDRDLFAELYEQSPLSTLVYDLSGHVILANTASERRFGMCAADLPARYTILSDPHSR